MIFFLLSTALALWGEETNTTVKLQELTKLKATHLLTSHSNWVKKVALSPDNTKILSGSADRDIKLWDIKTGKLLKTYAAHANDVNTLAFHKEGKIFLSADAGGYVMAWDVDSNASLWTIKAFEGYSINAMLITDDGQFIVSGHSKSIQIRDLATQEIIHTLTGHTAPIHGLTLSKDGTLLSASADATVKIWDIKTGTKLQDFQAHNNGLYAISMSNDGKRFVTGGSDSIIKVWNYESLELIRSSLAHRSFVFDVKFTADDARIISIGSDNNIKVWESETDCLLENAKAHFDWPKTLAIASDNTIVTGGYDKFMRIWQMPTDYGASCIEVENIPNDFRFPIQKDVNLSTEIYTSTELVGIKDSASILILKGEYKQGENDWVSSGEVVNGLLEVKHISSSFYNGATTTTVNIEGIKQSFVSITIKDPAKPKNFNPSPFSFPILQNVNLSTYVGATATISGLDGNVSISVINGEFKQFGEWQSSGSLSNGPLEVRHLSAPTYKTTTISTVIVGNMQKEFISITLDNTFKPNIDFLQLETLNGHSDHVFAATITPDGKNIISGAWDSTIKIWDLKTGVLQNTLEVSEVISTIEMSNDGRNIISGGSSHQIRIWDFETGVLLNSLEGHADQVHSIAINPADSMLVSGGNDKKIIVWDFHTGEVLHKIEDGQAFHSVTITKDGKYIVAGGREHQIKVWDINTGSLIKTIETNASIYAVSVSPDGERIISGGLKKTVDVWNFYSGENVFSLMGHTSIIREVAVAPNGRVIFSSGIDGKLNMWDLNSGELLKSIDNHTPVFALDISNNGRNIVLGGADASVRVLQVTREGNITQEFTQEMLDNLFIKTKTNVDLFSYIYEDVELYDTGGNISIAIDNGEFSQDDSEWETSGLVHDGVLHLRHLSASDFDTQQASIITLAGATDKQLTSVTYANASKPLHKYILEDTVTVQQENIETLLLTEDEKRIVFVTKGERINLLDIIQRGVIRTIETNTTINSIDIDSNASFAVIGDNKKASVWDLQTGEQTLSLLDLHSEILDIKISPDDTKVAISAKDKTVKIWDLLTGALIHILEHEESVFSLDFSIDNKKLVTASQDGTIRLWNTEDGSLTITLYQENAIKDVVITPDSKKIVTGGWDKTVRVWDISREQPIETFIGHSRLINTIHVSQDGTKVVSGGWDKVVKIWDIKNGYNIDTIIDLEVIYALSFNKKGDKIFVASGKKINIWRENDEEIELLSE